MSDSKQVPGKVRKSAATRGRRGRTGFTTGACAAAAARAAVLGLVEGRVPESVSCVLPNGQTAVFAVVEGRCDADSAHAVVIKDAGDDPDATNGARMTADVRRLPGRENTVVLCGGKGVGTVTKAGLGLEVGGPAINPVPRRNIEDNIRAVGGPILANGEGLEAAFSVPDGEERAKKTLNARLGILGGISILGTTGIVIPYSTAAFRASVVQATQVAANQGQDTVVFTTGGRTEKCAMGAFPDLDEACFVQMGDFVKAAFQAAVKYGMKRVIVGAMVGKLTKIAQGLPVTHAWRKEIDRGLLVDAARRAGAPEELLVEIGAAETARFAAERLETLGLTVALHRELARVACAALKARHPGCFHLTILACDFEGRTLGIFPEETLG